MGKYIVSINMYGKVINWKNRVRRSKCKIVCDDEAEKKQLVGMLEKFYKIPKKFIAVKEEVSQAALDAKAKAAKEAEVAAEVAKKETVRAAEAKPKATSSELKPQSEPNSTQVEKKNKNKNKNKNK